MATARKATTKRASPKKQPQYMVLIENLNSDGSLKDFDRYWTDSYSDAEKMAVGVQRGGNPRKVATLYTPQGKQTYRALAPDGRIMKPWENQNVTVREVADRSPSRSAFGIRRKEAPKRSGRDMGGDVVQERGRRHLRLW